MRSAVLLAAVVIGACTTVRTISLAQLASEQERFIGDSVRTSGTVRAFVDPDGSRYYVLEDSADHRVQLVPAGSVARYEGVTVTVVGVFDVRPALGRVLEVQSIQSASARLPSPLIGRPAPEFALKSMDGEPVSLADYRGGPCC